MDLQSLWQSGLESPKSAAILQKAAIQSQNRTELQQQTELELYKQTLRQGKDMCLADKQLSALFSLVKNVHTDAVAKRLTIDRSFDCFKQILLRHSVQRISCKVSSAHPGDVVELPPQLAPLHEADTEEQHQLSLEAQQKQEEAAAAKAAEDKAVQDESDRKQRIKDSFDAQMPDEISQKVQAALQKEMGRLQLVMSAQFAKQEAVLKTRVAELEQKAAAAGVA